MADQPPERPPSILASPRFFDDAPLSAWKLPGDSGQPAQVPTKRASTLEDSSSVPVWHVKGGPWPLPEHDEDPIMVELVRGADGPSDDQWSLVIDGLRCDAKQDASEKKKKRRDALVDYIKRTCRPLPPSFEYLSNESPTFEEDGQISDGDITGSDALRELYDIEKVPKKYMLPSGINPTKKMSADTAVRPVVVGIRLENEAVSPIEASLQVIQILHSDEMESMDPKETRSKETVRVELKPYRVRQPRSEVVHVEYPYRTPNQTSLGVISLQDTKRWRERQVMTLAGNGWNKAMFHRDLSIFNANLDRYDKYESLKLLSAGIGAAGAAVGGAVGAAAGMASGLASELNTTVPFPSVPAPQRDRELEAVREGSVHHFIIGGQRSVAQELEKTFRELAQHCEYGNIAYPKVKDALQQLEQAKFGNFLNEWGRELPDLSEYTSLKHKLAMVRQRVYFQDQATNGAFFDALFGSSVPEIVRELLSELKQDQLKQDPPTDRVSQLDPTGTMTAKDLLPRYEDEAKEAKQDAQDEPDAPAGVFPETPTTDDDKTSANLARQSASAVLGGNADYQFFFDRVRSERTQMTNVELVIRIEVRDLHSGTQTFELYADEIDGYAAHAVLSGHYRDILKFESSANRFVDCMFKKAPTATLGKFANAVVGAAQRVGDLAYDAYKRASTLQADATRLNAEELEILNFIGSVVSMYKLMGKKQIEEPPFKLNLENMELVVAYLKLMLRSGLPKWPPESIQDVSAYADSIKTTATDPFENNSGSKEFEEEAASEVEELKKYFDALAEENPNLTDDEKSQLELVQYSIEQRRRFTLLDNYDNILRNETDAAETAFGKLKKKIDELNELKKRVKSSPMDWFDSLSPQEQAEASTLLSDAIKLAQQVYGGRSSNVDRIYFPPNSLYKPIKRELPQVLFLSGVTMFRFDVPEDPDPPTSYKLPQPSEAGPVPRITTFNRFVNFTYRWIPWLAGGIFYITCLAWLMANVASGGSALIPVTLGQLALKKLLGDKKLTSQNRITQAQMSRSSIAYNLAAAAVSGLQIQYLFNSERRKGTEAAGRAARGVPVVQTFRNAIVTAQTARKERLVYLESLGITKQSAVSVVFSTKTGNRNVFHELRVAKDTQALVKADAVHSGDDWNSLPHGTPLQLMPPADVSDQIYETQVLRDMPINRTIQFMTGSGPNTPTLPSELAAREAFREILQVVTRHRRENLRGEHLVRTDGQIALDLVQSACNIMLTAYGVNAGVTLVDGDDPLWTCFHGSVVARLALRHYDVFEESERRRLAEQNGCTMLKSAVQDKAEFWIRPHRALVETFAGSLLEQAKTNLQLERPGLKRAPLSADLCSEAVRAFVRVNAMAKNSNLAGLVVASSTAHNVWFLQESEEVRASVRACLQSNTDEFKEFKDQEDFRVPLDHPSEEMYKAAWASRRLNPGKARRILVQSGLDKVINDLGSLDLGESADEKRSYICPFGSRLAALPGKRVFDLDAAAERLVWLETLSQTATRILDSLVEQRRDNFSVECKTITAFKYNNSEISGNARHPLALTVKNKKLTVPMSKHERIDLTNMPTANIGTILDAIDALEDGKGVASVQSSVRALRTLAFNAERLLHASALALQIADMQTPIQFAVQNETDAVALAIAHAMLTVETGTVIVKMNVVVPRSTTARDKLGGLMNRVSDALKKGCKVVSLAECCIACLDGTADAADPADAADDGAGVGIMP